MTNNLPKFLILFCLIFGVFFTPTKAFAAPRVSFDPSSLTVRQNNEFTVQLQIDAESNQTIGSDVVVSYAGADLDVVSVTNGGYFSQFQFADNASGRIELHGYVTSIYQSKTGSGTLATLRFRSTKSSGSSALTVSCDGSGNDSNILSTSGQNILSCSSINQVAISYAAETSATDTPTPTTASGNTPTPTTGNAQNNIPTCTSISANPTTSTGTPQAISFTCSGADQSGDVTAAQFTFGDGTTQLVQKNVGTSGSITTTHTYTSIGTFAATCRIRDNDYVFSSIPSGCQQTITIRARSGGSSTGGSSITYKTPTPTPKSGSTLAPTPTTPIVSIISVTPLPTFASYPTPSLYPGEEAESGYSSRFWWIIGGIVSLFLAILLLRKKKRPDNTPPNSMPPIIIQENTPVPSEPPPTNT